MKRKNPGPSSQNSAPIELTPLLDVIFICLFVVIIGYAQVAAAREQEAEEEIRALQEEVAALEAESFDKEAAMKAYQDAAAAYEGSVIGSRVMIVTVSCTYSARDAAVRQIRVLASDREYEAIPVTASSEKTAFARLSRLLEDYIRDHPDAVVVFSLNTDAILVRDKEAAETILQSLADKYDDVY